jgi:hypothetical protein
MLAGLRERGALKVEAFVAWLAERGIRVDRSLVSHWFAGRSHLPADMLPWLAQYTGRAEWVFGEYLRTVSCDVVHIRRRGPDAREVIDLVTQVGGAVGHLLIALLEARAPNSPGGEEITPDEQQVVCRRLDDLIQDLAELRALMGAPTPQPGVAASASLPMQ